MGSLHVDPVDLLMSSDRLDMLAHEHTQTNTTTNSVLAVSATRWIGTSAVALQRKLALLQKISSHIGNELEHNSRFFRRIGTDFERTDEHAAENILVTRQGH